MAQNTPTGDQNMITGKLARFVTGTRFAGTTQVMSDE
jgi:hypothetical protein